MHLKAKSEEMAAGLNAWIGSLWNLYKACVLGDCEGLVYLDRGMELFILPAISLIVPPFFCQWSSNGALCSDVVPVQREMDSDINCELGGGGAQVRKWFGSPSCSPRPFKSATYHVFRGFNRILAELFQLESFGTFIHPTPLPPVALQIWHHLVQFFHMPKCWNAGLLSFGGSLLVPPHGMLLWRVPRPLGITFWGLQRLFQEGKLERCVQSFEPQLLCIKYGFPPFY